MILQEPFAIGAFSPPKISGLKLWLKADSLSLSNNDPVASWTDSSGSGNDAAQSTAGNKPIFNTNIINSLPAVQFDGTDDFMTLAGNPIPANNDETIFTVIQPTLNTASQKTYATIIHGQTATFFHVAKLSTNFWGTYTGGTGDLSSTNALVSGTNYLLGNTSKQDGTSCVLYQRGVQVASRAEQEVGVTGASSGLGKDLVNANRQYAGYIAEVIIYDSVLSTGNRQKVDAYLINKYAL